MGNLSLTAFRDMYGFLFSHAASDKLYINSLGFALCYYATIACFQAHTPEY